MTATYGTLPVSGAELCFKVRGAGPVLLVIQGGAGDADTPDALAVALASEFTIITYDRRGLSRSSLEDPKQGITVEQHAEDAQQLLAEFSATPAFVFGSSLGALIALDLVARWPARVQAVVAHEPPALELLTGAEQASFAELRKVMASIALSEGTRAATRRFLREMGVNSEDHEDDVEPPPSVREPNRNADFFLTRESRAADRFRLDRGALKASAAKIVPAFGSSSVECFPARCACALATELGCEASEFPGGHTGYVLRPQAFSETLRAVLHARGSYSRLRCTSVGDGCDSGGSGERSGGAAG